MSGTIDHPKRLVLLAALGVLGAVVQGQESQPSSKYYAVRVNADEMVSGKNWVQTIGSALHAKAFQDDMAKRYRIVLLERPDGVSPDVFSSSMKRIEQRIPGVKSVQVYGSSKGLSIPTGQIVVVFKDGTPAADARGTLTHFGVKIVGEPTSLLPQQFVVESPDGTNAATLATKLAQDPNVRFAEPDFLQISVPPAK